MKRQTKRRIMALVMAALMLVGLIPYSLLSGAFSSKANAAEEKVITFDAATELAALDKSAAIASDTKYVDGFFTVFGTGLKRANMSDFAIDIGKKTTNGIEFTVPDGYKATVTISARGAGSGKTGGVTLNGVSKDFADASVEDQVWRDVPAGKQQITANETKGGTRITNVVVKLVQDVTVQDKTVTFDAATELAALDKSAAIASDTKYVDGFFTVFGTGLKRANMSDFAIDIGKKTTNGIEFTVPDGYKATVTVSARGAGSGKTGGVTLNGVSKDFADASVEDQVWKDIPSGVQQITANETKGGTRITKVEVKLTAAGATTQRKDWAEVAEPVISDISVKDGKITVKYVGVTGDDGADKITVTMTDEKGNKTDKNIVKEATEGTAEFTPSASGVYSFVVVATRENEENVKTSSSVEYTYSLPLAASSIISAYNKGNGVIGVEWTSVNEATAYVVEYSNDGKNWASLDAADKTEATIKGLTVGSEYSVRVVAKRGEDSTTSKEATIKVTKEAQQKWGQITYGNGASSSKDSFTGSVNEGKVTIKSKSGKLVPASFDGLSFYYTEVPASQNFTLRAKVTVDSWTLSNGQEGFGLMAADKLGGSGWNNSYMAVASKTEYYWNEETKEVTTDSSATKVSQKLGLASQEKTGVTKDNIAAIEANDTATVQANFKSTSYPLEQRYPEAKNIIGNSTTPADDGNITEMYLTIQKNNTGYFVTYESVDGSYSTTKKYYDTEALERIDSDYVYAGFFASRNATATFSDITFTTIDPKEDAPAEERPIEKVAVNTYVQSATATGSADYEFLFSANCDGTLSIEDANGEVIVSDVEVKADTLVKPASVTLNKGKNAYKINFTPAEGYKPNGEYSAMESYETVVIDHTVTYKTFGEAGQSIWVAPDAKGSGSKEDPMSIYDAVKYVMPSQQIVLTEGTYKLESPLKIARGINGTADQMIYMVADPDAKTRPVIDFQGLCTGMTIGGDYWYFKGFDVTGSADGQKGLQVSGSHNTLDQIETYHNGNTGLQISRLNVTDTYAEWPSYNLILNCTSYGNADKGYEDADGFAAKLTVGDGNVFDGCIAHHNADDGWDLFAKVQTGSIGSVTIKNSIAYANGYLEDGTNAGNGNGFKMGGDSMPGSHVLENSIAFANKAKGIDSNSCPDIKVKNCTSINNQGANVAFYTNSAKNTDFEATGVISFRTAKEDVAENIKPVGSQDLTKIYKATNFYWDTASKTSFNTPAAGEAVTTVSADWFASLDYSSILDGNKSVAGIVRNADGTIALGNIFKLTDKAPAGVGADFSIEKLTKSLNPTIGTPVPTGDKANTALYVVLIVLSVLAIGGVCFYEVKRKKNGVK